MKFIVLFLVIMLSLASCVSININEAQKKHFLTLLDKGYQWKKGHIYTRNKSSIKTCVYHKEPNRQSKEAIESFFNLLHQEFKVFSPPQYKKTLKMCSTDTDVYINLGGSKMNVESLTIAASNVFSRHNIILKKRLNPSLGQVAVRSMKNKIISFISIMQEIDEKEMQVVGDKKYEAHYLVPTIIEELYQAISLGRDINVRKKPMSKLHEDRLRFKSRLPYEFAKFEQYNPVALCGFDIWYLILIYGDEKKLSSYDAYSSKFLRMYGLIKKRAMKIENNPAYKGLFDPRCSGKNTGVNTKIGIR